MERGVCWFSLGAPICLSLRNLSFSQLRCCSGGLHGNVTAYQYDFTGLFPPFLIERLSRSVEFVSVMKKEGVRCSLWAFVLQPVNQRESTAEVGKMKSGTEARSWLFVSQLSILKN